MDPRELVLRTLISCILLSGMCCLAEKLSPDQKAPPFARGSGGLILKAPFEGGERRAAPPSNSAGDEVEREETEMLKLVDGQLVRTVEGHFSYKSPEGLPIFVKYVADENGNRASFKFGTGQLSGVTGGGLSNQNSKSSTYLPPKNVDRSYLPPQ